MKPVMHPDIAPDIMLSKIQLGTAINTDRNNEINAKGASYKDVRDSIRILLNNIDNHLNVCGGEKRKSELVKVSINTKTTTLKNYVSVFDTNFLMIS